MTVKLPGALWVPISRNYMAKKRAKTDCVILHVAVSEAKSLAGWFNNPAAGASSHFYVRRDGTIEQYLDLDYISWANGAGNSRSITVETQGGASGEWTPEQVEANVKIIRFANKHYGVPMAQMKDSKKSSRGVGYHLLGVPANRTQKLLGRSQTGGELWSSAVGKICPGPERVKQVPAIVKAANGSVVPAGKPNPPATQKPPAKPSDGKQWPYKALPLTSVHTTESHNAWVRLMADIGYKDKTLGTALQKWLKKAGFYRGLLDDNFGSMSVKAMQLFLKSKGFYKGVIDGQRGAMTVKAEIAYLNSQMKFY